MMTRTAGAALGALALLLPATALAAPVTYDLGGSLVVMVKYDRDALIAGHDHLLSSSSFSGTVTWDTEDPSACSVQITLPVETLTVDAPGMRSAYGLEGETGDGDKKTIKKNALSKGQLNADAHPNITYASSSCARAGDKMKVTGTLTVAGQQKTVSTTLTTSASESAFTAKGSFTANHSDFGFKPYTALLGSLRNAEPFTFYLDVKGTPK